MVDEGIVSFSVAVGFVAAIPLCALQGSWLVEWSLIVFFATWIFSFLTAYPFVCALLSAYYLLASFREVSKAEAGSRMEAATVIAGAFGVLCAAFLASSSRVDATIVSGSAGEFALAGLGMIACVLWYAATHFLSKDAEASPSAIAALALLLAASTMFGLVSTAGSSSFWMGLVLLYPFNLLLILAKQSTARMRARRSIRE